MALRILFAAVVGLVSQTLAAELPLAKSLPVKLPLTGQPPAKSEPSICLLHYQISSDSPDCQAHFDQGLAHFYSYEWGTAARSFETAVQYDPECPLAWWGLVRALDRDNKQDLALQALDGVKQKKDLASHREQFLITAMLQMPPRKPLPADASAEAKSEAQKQLETQRQAAIRTIDDMISLYDDDEEAWFCRAKLAGEGVLAVPFLKALARINPLHPGATHELVHFYDGARRPALAWPYTENYIKGSPGIPHAYHMQIDHIATHLGRWDMVVERAPLAHEPGLQMLALAHDGRFAEARQVPEKKTINRFQLHLAELNWDEARAVLEALAAGSQGKDQDQTVLPYLTALLHLKQEQPQLAVPSIESLQKALEELPEKNPKPDRRTLENRLWETRGLLQCQQGEAEAGLTLLAKVAERTSDSFSQMGWGLGAYYMETWGIAALKSGQHKTAELAFLEALTHDTGSARGALGMQVLCERQGRTDEAQRFGERARRLWQRADAGVLDGELAWLRQSYAFQRSAE